MYLRTIHILVSVVTIAVTALTLAACAARQTAEPTTPAPPQPSPRTTVEGYTGKVFLGIRGKSIVLPPSDDYESTHGLELKRSPALSTGDLAGLIPGDIIVSIDGNAWANDEIRLSRSFDKDGRKAKPGDVSRFVVLRVPCHDPDNPDAPKRLESFDVELAPYPRTAAEPDGMPDNDAIRPDLADHAPPYQSICRRLIDKTELTADCTDLWERIERCQQLPDPDRLPIMRYVHRDPFKLEAVTREIASPYLQDSPSIDQLLDQVEHVLVTFDRADPLPPPVVLTATYVGADLEGHLDYIAALLAGAAEARQRAFAKLSDDEQQFIIDHRDALLDAFVEYKMLSYDDDYDRQVNSVRLLDLAGKVNIEALLDQARTAAGLVDPDFVDSLVQAVEAADIDLSQAIVAERDTPHGKIAIAGVVRNRHDKHYAALYDLGGDDLYANNQAAPMPVPGDDLMPTAVLVDLAGHDAYECTDAFGQACGDMGVGILVDRAGNDQYIGMRFTQGAGFLGIGVLIDEAGDDTYRGIEFHQGVGHYGAGILLDRVGADRYEGHLSCQGVGLPGGYGLILDTGNEGDAYYCKGNERSGYGTSGVFEGWGQGAGMGYRNYASGGVGALIDTGGNDRIEGGNFSQGGGYFYGFGLVFNSGGNDEYIGSRYNQGFTAHQAAGAFIDTGGNDIYRTRYAVAQGLSWDETVTLFIDESGDDTYEGGSFSQGASAMNGIALFFDLAGRDTYLYCDQARAGGNHYHGGTSLSFFVDAGGDEDTYPSKPNNRILSGKEHFIFIDLPTALPEDIDDAELDRLLATEE